MASASPSSKAGVASAPATQARGALGQLFDALGIAAFALAWGGVAAVLWTSVAPAEGVLLLLLALPAGHLVADLLSGLLHWFADEFFEEDTPWLGPTLIYGFRDHHRNPRDILAHGVLEVSGYNALATLPLLTALWLWPPESAAGRAAHALVLALTLSVALTNQFHRFAHADRAPRLVGWLQRRRLILAPEAHARHHRRGDRAYCVTSGWCNAPLDALGVLPALSRRVHRLARGLRRAR